MAGVTDNTEKTRPRAVRLICGVVFLLAIPPMINFKVFVPWDLVFGSGMQTLGALLAVVTTVWCIKRSEALKAFAMGSGKPFPIFLYWWMRIVVPLVILFIGVNWVLEEVFKIRS